MEILTRIKEQGLILDGGMGSMLIDRGLGGGEAPETWNLTRPDILREIHGAYFKAGADLATANTFGATAMKLKKMGVTRDMADINRAGVALARAAAGSGQYVAGDMGSLGEMLEPMGPVSVDGAEACFRDQAEILEDAGVDLFFIETVFDLNLGLAAVRAVRSVSSRPVFCSLTFKETPKGFFTIFGNNVRDSMKALVDAGASGVGANCSMGSDTMVELAARIRDSVDVPVMIQPNAGLPQITGDNQKAVYPEEDLFFAGNIRKIKDLGIEIVGGCCGTTPATIREVKKII
ncbi:homocysteine S-methyltransferase family protein [Desulfospira joergensenii]|uniref:homocysteine S-methyltransferase family protein n=1 Tax=Desulfospira joergensenii TaxID=53329 RepID=UPI0003B4A70F|nr:homocysteine S-methyltransferase family protein [Desulfospira joergensenii]